jgi:DNA-directed RNA polymerase specialized sigma24 family protein
VEAGNARRSLDIELVRRMQADDLDAFEALFACHRTAIYRTAYGLAGDPQAAEEILQDTFQRAWQRRHTLRRMRRPCRGSIASPKLCYSRLGRRRLAAEPLGEGHSEVRDAPSSRPSGRAQGCAGWSGSAWRATASTRA